MSIINYYNNPLVVNWNLDEFGKPVSLLIQNETKQVVDGKIPLEGIPDEQYRIQITGYVEINIKDKIDAPNKFKCDYTHGVLYLDKSLNGTSVNIDRYYSRGMYFYPSSRVYLSLDVNGNVIQTLDGAFDVLSGQSTDIQALQTTRIHEGSVAPTNTKFWYDPTDE